jgi:membrane protease YdiL (CAAX protease family)
VSTRREEYADSQRPIGLLQYRHATTFMVLFAVSVVFAVARINTKGLLLPIALHGESALLALLLSKIY